MVTKQVLRSLEKKEKGEQRSYLVSKKRREREREKEKCVVLYTKPPWISFHLSLALDPRDEHLDS